MPLATYWVESESKIIILHIALGSKSKFMAVSSTVGLFAPYHWFIMETELTD